ncbi:MAG: pyrroline-5-carboxylate reductase [Endozoicomonas sp. (ex Botrylloides leachii)]|nr:pyrroline-5-carboxylate reductase [Endozoicomonas sp. (ex Botrylloides leachii)]
MMSILNKSIGVIGAGNMAQAIIGGLLRGGCQPEQIIATAPSEKTRLTISQQFGVHVSASNLEAAGSDVLLLCVKPDVMKNVLTEIAPVLASQKKTLVISVATGITVDCLERWAGCSLPVIRSMPNTPSRLGVGACGLFANTNVSAEDKGLAESIFSAVGIFEWVADEALIDTIIAVSGSAPAYYFLFMEAMKNNGVALGLTPEVAERLTQQTALGAAKMASESTLSVAQLRKNVCSPGGPTEQALQAFQQGGIEPIINNAMQAAVKRAKEMTKELSK